MDGSCPHPEKGEIFLIWTQKRGIFFHPFLLEIQDHGEMFQETESQKIFCWEILPKPTKDESSCSFFGQDRVLLWFSDKLRSQKHQGFVSCFQWLAVSVNMVACDLRFGCSVVGKNIQTYSPNGSLMMICHGRICALKVTFYKNTHISKMMIKTFSTFFLRKSFIFLLILYIFCHAKNCHDSVYLRPAIQSRRWWNMNRPLPSGVVGCHQKWWYK